MKKNHFKVSICVVTYNQAKYIKKCIDSMINQDATFKYEILVADDASTDGTQDILREYQSKYPELIKIILNESNLGTVNNIKKLYQSAQGEYIAHIDGDDFAFPSKISAQARALDENSDCTMCVHDVILVDGDDIIIANSFRNLPEKTYNICDLYEQLPFFVHSSKMFRNIEGNMLQEQQGSNTLDIEVHVNQAKNGNIYFCKGPLGGYRRNVGVSNSNGKINPLLYEGMERVFEQAYLESTIGLAFIKKCHAKALFEFAYQSALFNDRNGLRFYIERSVDILPFSFLQRAFFYLRYWPSAIIKICTFRKLALSK
ncbi:glycosyltransferase family 2 protein [Vibrio vulnificus]|uniref:glycosyltransferase family 2 protein n=1 Tax=Vibrio vulnificus TaxID=672 RepID=UPI0024DFA25D|nr:glycosyltransferase [Vibrio vulnificus]MDK2678968.1 glycosyltransferase [Vibrio vulnificus]MDK2687742.1 glycosyltransferase [Vibrio vulnificus]